MKTRMKMDFSMLHTVGKTHLGVMSCHSQVLSVSLQIDKMKLPPLMFPRTSNSPGIMPYDLWPCCLSCKVCMLCIAFLQLKWYQLLNLSNIFWHDFFLSHNYFSFRLHNGGTNVLVYFRVNLESCPDIIYCKMNMVVSDKTEKSDDGIFLRKLSVYDMLAPWRWLLSAR